MSQQSTPAFAEATDDHQVALSPFGHSDRDFAFDPLSTNRRLPGHADLPVLGTVVLAGPTPDTIHVMIPDCLLPPVGSEVHIDLRHVVTLQLGPATDIGEDYPPPGLALALCKKPLMPTLLLQQKDYWEEMTFGVPNVTGRSESTWFVTSGCAIEFYHICVLLEVPGQHVPIMVYIRT